MSANRHAESAQMESDEVADVNVRSTGDRASRARKIRIDDLTVFAPEQPLEMWIIQDDTRALRSMRRDVSALRHSMISQRT